MSRTNPTAPSSMRSIVRLLPTISACIGPTTAPHGAADLLRVSAEFGSPEPVAQDDHVLAARRVLLRPKDASERRSGSDDLEKACGDSCHTCRSRGARAGERELSEAAAWIHRHAL